MKTTRSKQSFSRIEELGKLGRLGTAILAVGSVGAISVDFAARRLASLPPASQVVRPGGGDTAVYGKLGEIRVAKASLPDFDADLMSLESQESRYRERMKSLEQEFGPKARLNRAVKHAEKRKKLR